MARRRMTTVLLAVSLMLIATVAAPAVCAERPDVLRVAIGVNPATLDPHITTNTITRQIAAHVFETLLVYDENYKLIPQLATEYKVSEDGKAYTFYLRDNVRFHNGKKMTSADVKSSIERFCRISPRRSDLELISAIDATDPLTLKISLKEPMGAFPFVLANPVTFLAIMPAEVADKSQGELPVKSLIGTGPLMIEEWKSDVRLVLKRFDGYSADTTRPASGMGGNRRVYFDKIEFIPVIEVASRVAGLETGTYDIAEEIPAAAYDRLKDNSKLKLGRNFTAGTIFEINHKDRLTSNRKIRQAVLAAINAEEILSAVTYGRPEFYRVQHGFFIPEQTDWHMAAGKEYYNQNDVNRAKALLKEAGYAGEEFVIITCRDYDFMYRAGLALQAQLSRAGMNVKLEVMDWPSQLAKAAGLEGWNINCSGWSLRLDPVGINSGLMSSSSFAYGYNNPEMEKLLVAGMSAGTVAERRAVYEKVQELLYTDVPVIRVGDMMGLYGWRAEVSGFKPWYIQRYWNVKK